jgi:hypothetical protein
MPSPLFGFGSGVIVGAFANGPQRVQKFAESDKRAGDEKL